MSGSTFLECYQVESQRVDKTSYNSFIYADFLFVVMYMGIRLQFEFLYYIRFKLIIYFSILLGVLVVLVV